MTKGQNWVKNKKNGSVTLSTNLKASLPRD